MGPLLRTVAFFLLLGWGVASADSTPSANSCRTVYVADHGWHTGLIVLAQDFQPRTSLRTTFFDDKRWIEVGWGDAAFYQAEETSFTLAVKALFSPTDAVMHVYAFDPEPTGNFPESTVKPVRMTAAGYRKMLAFVQGEFTRDDDGAPTPVKRGLYGRSYFFEGEGSYSLARTCNTWTAEALQAGGVAIDPSDATTAGGVMDQIAALDGGGC